MTGLHVAKKGFLSNKVLCLIISLTLALMMIPAAVFSQFKFDVFAIGGENSSTPVAETEDNDLHASMTAVPNTASQDADDI